MKARFFALAALVLGLASCQNDFDGVKQNAKGEVNFQLSVAAPDLGTTRAGENGMADDQQAFNSAFGAIDYLQGAVTGDERRVDWGDVDLRYTLEVYDVAADYTDAKPVKDRMVIIKDSYEAVTFELRLVPNRNYHFVIFADFVEEGLHLETDLNQGVEHQANLGKHHIIGETLADITITEDGINDECSDAYFATKDIKISNAAPQEIVLKRPYGKLRVIATDLAELNINVEPKSVKVAYSATHPQSFNALTGEIGAAVEHEEYSFEFESLYNEGVTKEDLANHFYTAGYDNFEEYGMTNDNGVNRHTHMTLFTDYILADEEQSPYHFEMEVYDANGELIKATEFATDIPVQRNFLTTVIGNVLTTATDIEVRIDDNFAGYHNYQLWDGEAVAEPKKNAEGIYEIYEASELAWLAAQVNAPSDKATAIFEGETFKLMKDIHLNDERWTPIGANKNYFAGTFDGNYHKIEGLFVYETGKASAGLFATCRGYVKNLTVLNAEVYGHYSAAVIVAHGLCSRIENCHVDDAIVLSTPYEQNDGNNVGAIAGYLSAEPEAYVKNCTVKNAKITAYRKVGGIVGAANGAAEVTGNYIKGSYITADMTAEYKEDKPADAGQVVGWAHQNAIVENNTVEGGINTPVADAVRVVIKIKEDMIADFINGSTDAIVMLPEGEYTFTDDAAAGCLQANGTNVILNVENHTLNVGSDANYGFIASNGATLEVNNANVVSNGGGIGATGGSKVTLNGSNVAVNTANTSPRYNIYADGEGSVVTVNGGEFTIKSLSNKRAYVYCGAGAKVIINDGTFGKASTRSGYTAGILGAGETIIYGGTFGFDPTKWVADGCAITKDGANWVVTAPTLVTSAADLTAAINNAIDGATIHVANGNYEGLFNFTGKKNLTVYATNGAATIDGMVWADNCSVTFRDMKFTNPNGVQHPNTQNSSYYTTINNQYPLVGAYNNANVRFENCTFDIVGPTVYGFYGYAHDTPVFEGCTFNCNGIRPIANNGDSLTVTGCTFNDAYHYAARIFENGGERQTVVFTNNIMQGTNGKGEFEGVNISKKGSTATVYADFTIAGNTEGLKYRYHKNVTLDASCTGAELFEKEE